LIFLSTVEDVGTAGFLCWMEDLAVVLTHGWFGWWQAGSAILTRALCIPTSFLTTAVLDLSPILMAPLRWFFCWLRRAVSFYDVDFSDAGGPPGVVCSLGVS
jgi:hypothetical protein